MTAFREAPYAGPADLLAMCDLCITLRRHGLGAEHSGDLNWAATMHAQKNPQRDTRLWWDGTALAAWATWNPWGLSFALSHAQRENLALLRTLTRWGHDHAHALSAGSTAPAKFTVTCFASHEPHRRLLAELGFTATEEGSLIVNARSLAPPLPEPVLPAGVVVRPPDGEEELDRRAQLHVAVWTSSLLTPAGYRITRAAPGHDAGLDLVAVLPDGRFAAYCICWPEPASGSCEFEPVGCHPDHRRQGLARAVMQVAMQRARAMGLHTALVYCHDDTLPFYRALGFAPVDRTIDHHPPRDEP